MELNVNGIFGKLPIEAILTVEQRNEIKEVLTSLGNMESYSTGVVISKTTMVEEVETTVYSYSITSIKKHVIVLTNQKEVPVAGDVLEIGLMSYGVVNVVIGQEDMSSVKYSIAVEKL